MKTKLLVMFGGISPEHEVSVLTGLQLLKNADKNKYEVTPVYLDKSGRWWTGQNAASPDFFRQADLLAPTGLEPFDLSLHRDSNEFDAAVLCFHGGAGERGMVQGALELAGIPYQGPGITSSAACFDKAVFRQILTAIDYPQPNFVAIRLADWQAHQSELLKRVEQLPTPWFVKPANGGSSIGVEKITESTQLHPAIERAFQFDHTILVEEGIEDWLEVNVSVLGDHSNCQASVPEQPLSQDELLSFADKYERGGGKKSGMASAQRRIPAPISTALTNKLQQVSVELFKLFDCTGVVRIDYFVEPSSEQYQVIEINTIPGSMSYYLWEKSGLPYPALIDRLVEISLSRHKHQQQLVTSFETSILRNHSLS